MKEYILCAAIWWNDGKNWPNQPCNINEGFVTCAKRHYGCIATIVVMGKRAADFVDDNGKRRYVHGFLTNKNRFVDRKEGGDIAFRANQINKETDCLFSEDLY